MDYNVKANSLAVQQQLIESIVETKKERVLITYKDTVGQAALYSEKSREVKMITKEELMDLMEDPSIEYIERDQEIVITTTPGSVQKDSWGINRIQPQRLWKDNVTGKDVRVAVLDTGIENHEDLTISGGVSFVPESISYYDDHGHGTHVAGIIAAKNNEIGIVGVAPEADIFSVKVLNSRGSGYLSDVVKGIEWSMKNNMDIINLSLSATEPSYALIDVIDRAKKQGIVIVAAAGNRGITGSDSMGYPAKLPTVISVGATNENDQRASFSSIGPNLKVMAPGENILSTYKDNTYKSLNGTSMATPFVAGVVALMKQENGELTVEQVQNLIYETAIDLGVRGVDEETGYGLLQIPVQEKLDLSVVHPKNSLVNKKHLLKMKVTDVDNGLLEGVEVMVTFTMPNKQQKFWKGKTTDKGLLMVPFLPKTVGIHEIDILARKNGFQPLFRDKTIVVKNAQ